MDEMSKQLVSEVREKLPARPGSPEKYDAHYLRRGECTVWMFGEPLSGWRTVAVTKRRTTLDWAQQVRALANLPRYRDAETITLVCDNLNTHSGDSFYAARSRRPEPVGRLNDRIHLVHTPKHGSWLNVAELEFSALHRQCLDRRIESRALVTSETAAWAKERNREQTGVDWQLSVDDARTKLKHLYPKIKTSYTTRWLTQPSCELFWTST